MLSNWCTLTLLNYIDGNVRWFEFHWYKSDKIIRVYNASPSKIEPSISFSLLWHLFSSFFVRTYVLIFQDVDSSWIFLKFCRTKLRLRVLKFETFSSTVCVQNMKSQWCSQLKSTVQSTEAFNQSRKIKNYFNWFSLWRNNIFTQTIEKCRCYSPSLQYHSNLLHQEIKYIWSAMRMRLGFVKTSQTKWKITTTRNKYNISRNVASVCNNTILFNKLWSTKYENSYFKKKKT